MWRYVFDEYEVDAETGRLWIAGEEASLRHKCRQLLLSFLQQPQTNLTRDALIEMVWNGDVTGDASLSKAITELRSALKDDSKNPRYIQTLPKVGYCWIAEVEKIAKSDVEPQAQPQLSASESVAIPQTPQRKKSRNWWLAGGLMATLLILIFVNPFGRRQSLVASQPASQVVILPFANQTGEADKDWLVLGLADFVASILEEGQHVRPSKVAVIDRWLRSQKYDLPLDAIQKSELQAVFPQQAMVWVIAKQHAQGYQLIYQIEQAPGQVITGTLVGENLIALAERLAKQVHEQLSDAVFLNFNHAKYIKDPAITQLYIEARTHAYAGKPLKAKERYEVLIERAPDFLWAKTGLATALFTLGQIDERYDRLIAEAEALAIATEQKTAQTLILQLKAVRAKSQGQNEQALELFQAMLAHPHIRDSDRAQAHLNMGAIYGEAGDYARERSSYEQALALDESPYDRARILNNLGAIATDEGDYAKGEALLKQALVLNQKLSQQNEAGNNLLELGRNAFEAGKADLALQHYQAAYRGFEANQNVFYQAEAALGMADAYGKQKQLEQALSISATAIQILQQPEFETLPHYEKNLLADAYVKRSQLHKQQGEITKAKIEIERAIQLYKRLDQADNVTYLESLLARWQVASSG